MKAAGLPVCTDDVTGSDCVDAGGDYMGISSLCRQAQCLVGACCDEATATCNDDLSSAACNASGGRFVANALCADLAQPCSGGGCCNLATGACTDVLPAGCPPTSQFHLGTFCDCNGGDLICNVAGNCRHQL